ncbi:MAG: SDR family NAD(P)-dependent oxidoreductase, partial [Gammaproteobacteria bacterium]|nr:SDR family NAD(P)-dependent oxidoreductase [Gammaproteobacteria bacterium]
MNDIKAFITGAAHRIGATIARTLHAQGANIALHYRASKEASAALQKELLQQRADSVILIQADLLDISTIPKLIEAATGKWGGLDVLINNASSFYPTPVGSITLEDWDNLVNSNMKAPLFL